MKDLTMNIAFYFPFFFDLIVSIALVLHYKKKVKRQQYSGKQAKRYYSIIIFLAGLFSGTILFFGLMQLFHLSAGHGEVIIASFLGNLFLALVLIVVGRILIGWKAMVF